MFFFVSLPKVSSSTSKRCRQPFWLNLDDRVLRRGDREGVRCQLVQNDSLRYSGDVSFANSRRDGQLQPSCRNAAGERTYQFVCASASASVKALGSPSTTNV